MCVVIDLNIYFKVFIVRVEYIRRGSVYIF